MQKRIVITLFCICHRKHPKYKKGDVHKAFPNLLWQNFSIDAKNKIWCADFTYLKLANGLCRYNCSIIDLYDRSVISTVTGKWITRELAILALEKGLYSQGVFPNVINPLIFHTDQGSQFTSESFTNFCKDKHITQSMSKAGCPYDNAPMERFYNTMKGELIHRFHFQSDEELNYAISEYVYNWYNQI